jgi:hypothetical protein
VHRLDKQAALTNVCPLSQKLGAIDLIIDFAYEVNPRAFSLRNLGHRLNRSDLLTKNRQDNNEATACIQSDPVILSSTTLGRVFPSVELRICCSNMITSFIRDRVAMQLRDA